MRRWKFDMGVVISFTLIALFVGVLYELFFA